MFSAGRLQRPEDRSDDGTAESNEGDHHDEPPDRDRLGDDEAAAGLWVLLLSPVRQPEGRRGTQVSMGVGEVFSDGRVRRVKWASVVRLRFRIGQRRHRG